MSENKGNEIRDVAMRLGQVELLRRITKLMNDGKSFSEIAKELGLAESSVRIVAKNIG